MEQNNQSMSPYYKRPGQGSLTPSSKTSIEPPNKFARASMTLGIIALISAFTFTIYPPIILGSLAIILALLSRGATLKMHTRAKDAIRTSVIAITCNVALLITVFVVIFGNFEAIYGMSYQEMMEQMEDGTLDYDELYENIYNNMYKNNHQELPQDSQESIEKAIEELPEFLQDDFRRIYEEDMYP